MDIKEEKTKLENISQNSRYCEGIACAMIKHTFKVLKPYITGGGGVILEMGPAEGVMTDELVKVLDTFSVVEGSRLFAENLKRKYPHLDIHNSLFEEFQPSKKFDVIILGHVLEHVDNPVEILKKAKQWLQPNGIVFCAVPNSHSIHRQAAVLMGLLERENSMSELDIHHGHRRVYSKQEFESEFIKAGLKIQKSGGYWLKPLSNAQMQDWTESMIDAFMQLGEKYPDIAAENYVVAGL